jgi:II/X family phage/plasmid replication protein
MLDTIRLRSPYLAEDVAQQVGQSLDRKISYRNATGTIIYDLTTGQLEGSFDCRISVQVKREEVIAVEGGAVSRPCDPYLILEGSVHKAMLGHNITGGPCSFIPAATWYVDLVSGLVGVPLPPAAGWEVRRIDWAECYRLPYEAIEEYIGSLNSAVYPRRKVHRYGREAIFSPGTTTAVKVYHKGPEVHTHDLKRLRLVMDPSRVIELQQLANEVMRVETSIKAKKLGADISGIPLVREIEDGYLRAVHDREVGRLLKEGRSDMETVRTRKEVKRRLYDLYSTAQATALFATWLQLAALGEEEVKRDLKRTTFYRHRKQLMDGGCAWTGADVHISATSIPSGFSLTRRDPRRLTDEDPEVSRLLEPYRMAA